MASLKLLRFPDTRWLGIWVCGLLAVWIWDMLFLNAPALRTLQTAFLNTLVVAGLSVVISALVGLGLVNATEMLQSRRASGAVNFLRFLLDLIRSIPQIIGILIGYVILTGLVVTDVLSSTTSQVTWIAVSLAVFVTLDWVDLLEERIKYFKQTDFYGAMLSCGISRYRILNLDILWRNSAQHIVQKSIAVFGMAIFLLCSIDFIVSVGLSTEVSLANFPQTLGSMLAKLDSKQDILAIGTTFTQPTYIDNLFFEHLQGISVAFVLVFTLLCLHKIGAGYLERKKL